MTEEVELSSEERRAIASLKRLAKRWPETLWLFSASGSLCVMRYAPDGQRAYAPSGGVDGNAVLSIIDIPNDGGDW